MLIFYSQHTQPYHRPGLENLFFTCEEVNVFMKHIGGYPGRYAPGVKDLIIKNNIQLFISGHSHILKVNLV